jgi:hypothetical protein
MSIMTYQPRIFTAVLLLCFVVYALGVYLTRVYLCQPIGAWVLLGGVSVGAVGCIQLVISAVNGRSLWLAAGAFAVSILLTAMFLFIGVLTLPGCSGV